MKETARSSRLWATKARSSNNKNLRNDFNDNRQISDIDDYENSDQRKTSRATTRKQYAQTKKNKNETQTKRKWHRQHRRQRLQHENKKITNDGEKSNDTLIQNVKKNNKGRLEIDWAHILLNNGKVKLDYFRNLLGWPNSSTIYTFQNLTNLSLQPFNYFSTTTTKLLFFKEHAHAFNVV